METREWYSVRSVFEVVGRRSKENETRLFEERIILLKANSFDEAIAEAEKEALAYAHKDSSFVYLGYVNVYKLTDTRIKNKTEVYFHSRRGIMSRCGLAA